MAYRADIYHLINSTEYEYKFAGRYGAKGEKRSKRQKITPEQVARQNKINRINKMRRLIKANFMPGDIWLTLKYPVNTRKELQDVRKDVEKFRNRMKRDYKKRGGEEFKWIQRIEIGKRGGLHVHMLINAVCGVDLLIMKNWDYHYNMTSLYDNGDYKQLASYIVKDIPEDCEHEQLNLFGEDKKQVMKYSSSRNLIRPVPERKEYVRRTMKELILNGPRPREGFYIDKESIRIGINQSGYSYVYYTEIRIKKIKRVIKQPPDGREGEIWK